MRWLVILSLVFLTGCSNLSLSDVATASGATAAAAVTAATGLPASVIITSTAVGGVTAGALVEDQTGVDISEVENEFQAEVAETKIFWDFVLTFVEWIIGAVVALIVIAWLIPGPQSLWRRNHAKPNSTGDGTGSSGSDT